MVRCKAEQRNVLQCGREPPRRFLRTYAPLYGVFATGGVLALLDTVARGRSLYSLLGAYRATEALSARLSRLLDRFDLKTRLKKLIRARAIARASDGQSPEAQS